jgi:hypothetical protein
MDENEHDKLSNITLKHKLKFKEQHFYYCSVFHGHSNDFNNEHNSYPKMSVKQPVTYI